MGDYHGVAFPRTPYSRWTICAEATTDATVGYQFMALLRAFLAATLLRLVP